MPPAPPPPTLPPHPRAEGLCPGARGPHSLCHRRPAPATRRSWWSQDRRHLRASRVWPSPRPRPRSPAWPRRPPSQTLPQPLARPPPPPPARAPPPPPAAPRPRVGEWGGGGAHQPLPAIHRAPRPPSLREPAALLSCANLTPQPERTALQKRGRPPSPLQGQHPIPAAPSRKPPIISVPLTQTQTLLILLGPIPQIAGPSHSL